MSSSSPNPSIHVLKRMRTEEESELENDQNPSSSDSESEAGAAPEIPATSHAERRRQKKKIKQQVGGDGLFPNKKLKLDPSSGVPKRQNSVWVGNLSFKTTLASLRAFFEGVGEITRIHMPIKASASGPGIKSENRGFAYVDFATPEAKAAAIDRSEQPLTGRRLLIKDGDDFMGRPAALASAEGNASDVNSSQVPSGTGRSKTAQKILRAQKQPPAPTLFLGNLGFMATEDTIRGLFEAHRARPVRKKGVTEKMTVEGNEKETESNDAWIRKVRLGTFEDSGLCKGFAFVDFTSIENATSALINPKNHHLDGRKLVVEYASLDAVRRGGSRPEPKKGSGGPRSRKVGHPKPRKASPLTKQGHSAELLPLKKDPGEARISDNVLYQGRGDEKGVKKREKRIHSEQRNSQQHLRSRPKPGAALALAKRESAAILPSTAHKIIF